MRLNIRSTILFGTLLCLCSTLQAQDKKTEKPDTEKKKPSPVKISGVFEASESSPVSAGVEHIKSLVIKKIVAHGTHVKKGQSLVWFQTDKPDEQIKDAERSHRLAELTMSDDEFAYDQFVETQKLDRAAAVRARDSAQQSFDNFNNEDRDRQVKSANFSLKSSKASLESAAEELKQLEQMYKEDDLTEESEEIVLKRARQAVEFAEFRLESVETQTERTLKQDIPESDASHKDRLARAQLTFQKATRDLDSARKRRDIEMAQKREKFQKQVDDLKKLRGERSQLVIRAPIDGIFYHGVVSRGKISDKPSTLKDGSIATGKQVLGTIAKTGKLQVRLDVTETLLRRVKQGATAKIMASVAPKKVLKGKVKSIGSTPYVSGKFDCLVTVNAVGSKIVPGMTCQVEITEGKTE